MARTCSEPNSQGNINRLCTLLFDTRSPGRPWPAPTLHQLAMEASLTRALEQGELSLAFEPIHQLASRRITAFEALTRRSHSEPGDVSPGRFIPLAEEMGLLLCKRCLNFG